jgi:hypothetical protein
MRTEGGRESGPHGKSLEARDVFRQDGYDWQIHRALNCHPNISQPNDNADSVAFLHHVGPIFNRITRVLSRHNIKSVGPPPKKLPSFLQLVKDNLGLRTPGAYRIPVCGKDYNGQTGRSVDTRLKEYQWHTHLEYPDKSAMAEYSVYLEYHIQFHNTSILATKTRYMDHIIREAIEIELHPNNMNKEVCLCLSKSCKPLIYSLKKPEHDTRSTRLHRSIHAWQL